MSRTGVIIGGIVAGLGVVSAGVSTAITGIQSTRLPENQEDDRRQLLASTALVGFGTIFLIASLIVLFIYSSNKRKGVKKRGLLITFWILFGLFLICALVGGVLIGLVGRKPENSGVQGALTTAAVLPAVALVLLLVGFFIINGTSKPKSS